MKIQLVFIVEDHFELSSYNYNAPTHAVVDPRHGHKASNVNNFEDYQNVILLSQPCLAMHVMVTRPHTPHTQHNTYTLET